MLLYIVLSIIGGILVVLQSQVLGDINKSFGVLGSIYYTYLVGFLAIVLLVVAFGKYGLLGYLVSVKKSYYFMPGIYGIIIVGIIALCTYNIGLMPTFVIIFVTQVVFGKIVEHYGIIGSVTKPTNLLEFISMIFLIIGTLLLLFKK